MLGDMYSQQLLRDRHQSYVEILSVKENVVNVHCRFKTQSEDNSMLLAQDCRQDNVFKKLLLYFMASINQVNLL